MKRIQTQGIRSFFRVVGQTDRSQAATMTLRPGQTTGGDDNVHADSDQWLFVVSGVGSATVKGCPVPLEPGTLLLVEAGEPHEIANTGREPLVTINVYAPSVY